MPICNEAIGIVVEEGTNIPQAGVVVRAVVDVGRGTTTLAQTVTNDAGRFSLKLDGGLLPGASNVVRVEVYRGVSRLDAHGDVQWVIGARARRLVICVNNPEKCATPDDPPPEEVATTWLHGRVRHDQGQGLPDLVVRTFTVDYDGENQVGQDQTTNADGWFSTPNLSLVGSKDLRIKVYQTMPDLSLRLVGRSRVQYGYNGGSLRIDIEVCDDDLRGPSEFVRITDDISRVLYPTAATHPDPLLPDKLRDMTPQGAAWLSQKTGWPLDSVVVRGVAEMLTYSLSAPSYSIGAQPLYGLLRLGFPRTGDRLLARSPSQLQDGLDRAKNVNLISAGVSVPTTLTAFVRALAVALDDGDPDDLGEILRTSSLLTDQQVKTFCLLRAGNTGTEEDFWASVAVHADFQHATNAYVNEAKRLVRLGTIALGFAPIVEAILAHPQAAGSDPAERVGGWLKADWDAVAGNTTPMASYAAQPIPPGLPGGTDAEKRAALAQLLFEHAGLAFPSTRLNESLKAGLLTLPRLADVLQLPGNEALDLRTAKIYDGTADVVFTSDPALKATEIESLRTAQRLLRVAPLVRTTEALAKLEELEVTSAQNIVLQGTTRFVARYAAADPTLVAEAKEIAANASVQTSMAASLFLQAHPALGQAGLRFVPNGPVLVDGVEVTSVTDAEIPGYSQLFVSPQGTRCSWCQSIHGPTAYFVDLLHWLDGRVGDDGTSALDHLKLRRQDLTQIPLTCENTERVLPYIDLSLEILEQGVAGAPLTAYSSDVETAELLASPQHIHEDAYNATNLGGSTRSFVTPFHRALVEGRSFLAHLGFDRSDLMRTFRTDVSLSLAQIAHEELGLSTAAAAAITDSVAAEDTYWTASLLAGTASVRDLRRAAEVSYTDLLDLLHTRTANPAQGVGELVILMEAGADPYDVSSYVLKQVTAVTPALTYDDPTDAQYRRLRKTLRLWKATRWSLLDLDKVLASLGASDTATWTDSTLEAVADVHRLVRTTEVEPLELSAWFGVLDTYLDRSSSERPSQSLYDRTFLNPSLFPASERNATDGTNQLFPFALNATRDELDLTSLANTGQQTLADHASRLAAVLATSIGEVAELIDALHAVNGLDTYLVSGSAVPSLTLANLSRLYRWVSLGRTLDLSSTETVRLVSLRGGAGPFASPSQAIAFIEEVRALQAMKWSVDELEYLLVHGAMDRAAPTDDYLRGVLGRLRDAARAGEGSLDEAAAVDALVQQLAAELQVDRTTIDTLNSEMWVGGLSSALSTDPFPTFSAVELSPAEPATTITATTLTPALTVTLAANANTAAGPVSAGQTIRIENANTQVHLTNADANSPIELVSGGMSLNPIVGAGEIFVVQTNATVSLDGGATTTTLSGPAEVYVDAATEMQGGLFVDGALVRAVLLSRFLRPEFTATGTTVEGDPWSDLTRDAYPHDHAVLEAILKAVGLIKKLGANQDEQVAWRDRTTLWSLLDPATLLGGTLELRSLATLTGAGGYERLRNTSEMFALRTRLRGSAPTFATLITDPTDLNLSERTGWDLAMFTALLAVPIASVDAWRLVLDRADAVRRSGADVTTVRGWVSPGTLTDFTSTTSRQIVSAARSKYASASAWANVARPVRDRVRKAQRDALVSHLLVTSSMGFEDADDIYQHYLIDVSMNPEMLTSRIVQANATVQLFVHRCMFGLEFTATAEDVGEWFDDEDRAQWEWMRTYRVWEAARKVFLYPENWIEPELRDDKTPFFSTLESELAQGDVSDDRVEEVTLAYLDRLLTVASLKVLACYRETDPEDDSVDNFHVFARTRSEPASYWYRCRANGVWTPWEEIKAGVTGEHLIPVVYNRRLMLLWAEFIDMQSGDENALTEAWWDIRISQSEYRDGKWAPKRMSGHALALSGASSSHAKSALTAYAFASSIENGLLVIECYIFDVTELLGYDLLGSFTLNPCTMDFTVDTHANRIIDYRLERYGVEPAAWYAPGYWMSTALTAAPDTLSVYNGEWDDELQSAGSASPVELLQSASNSYFVLPNQWWDFVSQSAFLMNVEERAYCIELVAPLGSALEDAAASDDPPVAGLASFRGGIALTTPTTFGLSEEESEDAIAALNEGASVSDGQAADEVVRAGSDLALIDRGPAVPLTGVVGTYRFSKFYHPYACRFIEEVRRAGTFGLLDPDPDGVAGDLFRQAIQGSTTDFDGKYEPTGNVALPYPVEAIDFGINAAYSTYNWEIFFHIPFYLANRLADEGRYQEAINWFHMMFDPRTRADVLSSGVEGAVDTAQWWKVKPFLTPASETITDWIAFTGAEGDSDVQLEFDAQVAAWRSEPFNPHQIARLRPGTYQRAVVMRYIDTLIAWGDQLFTRDTLESLNEATQLYVFAKQVLGDRPELLGPVEKPAPKTYDDLAADLDSFSNPIIALENAAVAGLGTGTTMESGGSTVTGLGSATYFCVPFNAKLLSYWDTLEDRLFKIRNGMNIGGVVRSLPLFQPPIDPAMLVRAAAAGLDISSVVGGAAQVPYYRFSVMLQRAQALAGSVRGLGQALLGALEKRDAEALAMLRQTHETALLEQVTEVRERQVEEAQQSLRAARRAKDLAEIRHSYYDRLIDKGWNAQETAATVLSASAQSLQAIAAGALGIAQLLAPVPQITTGVCPGATTGGEQAEKVVTRGAQASNVVASGLGASAGVLTTTAAYKRRKEEWKHQRKLAKAEIEQHDKLIDAAKLRVDIAQRELSNHQMQIRHSDEVREWMERKYTNQELYGWMISQFAALHFQTWQLAYDAAKKAEACYNHELGRSDTFVQAVHWDSARKGLLAGERLQLDLERMDSAYLDRDVRENEVTKHVSLGSLDAVALAQLRESGTCFFNLPEAIFDLDFPGHYFRRIRGITLSLPAVTGPFAGVNATLTLVSSSTRTSASTAEGYARLTPEDARFADSALIESVTLSGGQDDGGMFTFDMRDSRYLPFERRGVISTWKFELSGFDSQLPQIDWDSIGDLILHVRYTSRYDGVLATEVVEVLKEQLSTMEHSGHGTDPFGEGDQGLLYGFSAKRDFPDAWHAFMSPPETADDQVLTVPLDATYLPVAHQRAAGRPVAESSIYLVPKAGFPETAAITGNGTVSGVTVAGEFSLGSSDALPSYLVATGVTSSPIPQFGTVEISFSQAQLGAAGTGLGIQANDAGKLRLGESEVDDVIVVLRYTLT